MATDTQSPWVNQALANGSTYPEAGHKKRRQRGKRRWPPKVGEQMLAEPEDETALATFHTAQAEAAAHDIAEAAGGPEIAEAAGGPEEDASTAEEQGLIDPELIRVLHSLSNTIDTAHHVLYAAAEATNRQAEASEEVEASARSDEAKLLIDAANPQQIEGLSRSGGSPNGFYSSRGGLPPFPPIPPEPPAPASNRGLKFATAATVLIVVGAIGWTLNANPGLISGVTESFVSSDENTVQTTQQAAANGVADTPKTALSVAVAPQQQTVDDPLVMEGRTNSATLVSPSPLPSNEDTGSNALPTRRITNTVSGPATAPIRLGLEAPMRRGDTELSAMIQGVPEPVALSAGQRIAGGT